MAELMEVRWHSRGGQGAMLAVRTIARTVIRDGRYAQGLPEFGAERMGAPIRCYNRISNEPFSLYCGIVNPDVVVVLDPSVMKVINVTEGLKDGGSIIINIDLPPKAIRDKLGISLEKKTYVIDAVKISMETLGRPMPNTPIMGALIKVSPFLTLECLLKDVEREFTKRFSQKVVAANLAAIKRGYEEVQEG
ncbi:MAG: 2-oxoacid:acceptor oxidoreductase family protein [Deltaproteobacteria bacterium]|nr:2-oxoacid:acceptor oxidoreductase family protein [Deltaproteobacteria bacterium]